LLTLTGAIPARALAMSRQSFLPFAVDVDIYVAGNPVWLTLGGNDGLAGVHALQLGNQRWLDGIDHEFTGDSIALMVSVPSLPAGCKVHKAAGLSNGAEQFRVNLAVAVVSRSALSAACRTHRQFLRWRHLPIAESNCCNCC